jgi:hypothetical protein
MYNLVQRVWGNAEERRANYKLIVLYSTALLSAPGTSNSISGCYGEVGWGTRVSGFIWRRIGLMADFCECGDEHSGSSAMDLVSYTRKCKTYDNVSGCSLLSNMLPWQRRHWEELGIRCCTCRDSNRVPPDCTCVAPSYESMSEERGNYRDNSHTNCSESEPCLRGVKPTNTLDDEVGDMIQ